LVIKTAYAGEVFIEWGSVDQFASDEPLVLTRDDQQTVTGTVKSVDNDLVVTTAQGEANIGISDVAFLRSLSDQAAFEKSLYPNLLQGWAGGGNFGSAFARGNSQMTNLALGFDAKRKTATDNTIPDLLAGLGYTRESHNTGLTRNLASTTIGDEFTSS
jgi:hypothetical protein